jgi:CRISPR/Cas system CSM-associated protein Csm3 (group 7 of RAMP superfamily)
MNTTGIIKWEGTATALSSVTHGEQSLGTGTYMRREKFLLPSGIVDEIPLVSGNALRGSMRDHAAKAYWQFLGKPHLNLSVSHALFSGGTISKATNAEPVSGIKLREIREACPPISIFGAAGGGRIIDGILSVGKMLPITQETAHIIPEKFHTANLPSYWDLLQLEEYSRFSPKNEDTSLHMRYGIESFIAGTNFYTWLNLDFPSAQDISFFDFIVSSLEAGEIPIGGQKSKGFGKVKFNFNSPEYILGEDWKNSLTERFTMPEIIEIIHRIK